MSKLKAPLIAALIVTGGLLVPTTVRAAACPTGSPGVPITTLATPPFFSCELGGFRYLFDIRSQLSELTASPTAALIFETSQFSQTLRFTNLANNDPVDFIYFVTPLTEEAVTIQQLFTQSPAGSPPPFEDSLATSTGLPTTSPFDVRAIFEVDNPSITLTELTHTMVKTPGPLPILGAGATFAFSRKLRRRISRGS
jgi:hypothetical protein